MLAKILLVDDEPDLEDLIVQKFKKKIRDREYQFIFARNGIEALNKLAECTDIDLILTDINMPSMDGLTLLAKIQDINPIVKTIIISAYGNMENIRRAMNKGAFDFLIKPIDFKDLEITINKTFTYVQKIKENLNLRQSEACAREQNLECQQALYQLQKTQAQLIQNEKMASLGRVAAGVAHEINNPVNFIYGNIEYVVKDVKYLLNLLDTCQHNNAPNETEEIDLEFLKKDLPKILLSMKTGANRIRQIVLSLRNFARLDEADMKLVDIHYGIESTLMILEHRLKTEAECPPIQVNKKYGELPLVECYPGELNQVFMNILNNAVDALGERINTEVKTLNTLNNENDCKLQPRTISICTQMLEDGSGVAIQIQDNGLGMSPVVKDKIFEPFFTTKAVGCGTGLGLFVSYRILVERHGGKLECFSEAGRGTTFYIEIPVRQTKKLLNI